MNFTFAHIDWTPLWLSFQVATAATALAVATGVPLAWLLARRAMPGRHLLEALITLPLALPPTVLGYYLLVALGRASPLGRAYQALTGSPLTFTLHGAVWASTVHALPLLVRGTRAAVAEVDPALERAARTLGATELRVALTVTLPLARRGMLASCALAFARALGEFGVTLMVAGNIQGETQTASLAIYDALQAGRDADAAALAAVLTAIALAAVYIVGRAGEGRRHD